MEAVRETAPRLTCRRGEPSIAAASVDCGDAMGKLPYAALTVTLVLWASSFPAIKAGLEGYSPIHLAALRFATASVALAGVAPLLGVRLPRRQDFALVLALGVLGVSAYHVFLNYGEALATASAAAFIANVAPLFAAVLARTIGETPARRSWLGLVAGLMGVWLISASLPGEFALNEGCLLLLLAAFCWSLFFVLQKPLLAFYSPLEVTCYAVWTGTLLLALFLPGAMTEARAASVSATLCAVYLGIVPTACAYLCWSYVLAKISVARAAIYTYLVPIISAAMSYAWLGERPTALFSIGAAAVLLGVGIAYQSGGARVVRR
jgi:drug/metabolite transporter (DMT)-like permease